MYNKRVPVPRARPEDPLSGCPSADPSPKKQKTCAGPISPQGSSRSKRSRLEEQLACSAAELRYIDSQSPENQQVAIVQSCDFFPFGWFMILETGENYTQMNFIIHTLYQILLECLNQGQ